MNAKKPISDKVSEKVIPTARGKATRKADYDRNRDGLYGGLPKIRDSSGPGGAPEEAHPHGSPRRRT